MLILNRILAVLSALLLGAHFLRDGSYLLPGLCVALAGLAFLRRSWVATLLQLALAFGIVEWIRTTAGIASHRASIGVPYGRAVAILAAVIAAAGTSVVLLSTRRVRSWYGSAGNGVEWTPVGR